MRSIGISIVSAISFVFFLLSYSYFSSDDFYYKSNLIIGVLILALFVLGFFLGRFFPFGQYEDEEKEEENRDDDVEYYKKAAGNSQKETFVVDAHQTGEIKKDNLQLIEGIGPKVQELFYNHGVHTFAEMSKCSVEKMQGILKSGGDRFILCNPETWAYQADLASKKEWGKLKEYQDFILRGVE